MKVYFAVLLSLALAGCGTINTTFSPDSKAGNKLTRWKSNCSSIPRVYSGVSLDYCAFDAEPQALRGHEIRPAPTLILLDMAASGIADTVLLPYTVYLQNKHGNIKAIRFE